MRFSAAIFDLDGTLCNTIGDLKTSMNEMLRLMGHPEVSREVVLASINNGAREFVRGCLPDTVKHDDTELDRCFTAYKECYSRHYLDTTFPYEGLTELIRELSEAGIKLGVLSNKQDPMTKALIAKLYGYDHFDERAVWGHAFLPHKPNPAAAYYIAGTFGVRPDEVAFIGDSNIDIMTAINAEMHPVGVTWGYRSAEVLLATGAKILCDTPCELRDFLLGR